MSKSVLWITRTAVFIALLVVLQGFTAIFGNTLITGSVVNMVLIGAVMTCGLSTGATVAFLSPVFAKFVGIGPLWSLIPFIVAGNLALVVVWDFIGNRKIGKQIISYILSVVAAAVAKFLVLYMGIVKIAVPVILQLPEPQASVISSTFSIPQLFTALAGGAVAVSILPFLKNSMVVTDANE